MTDLPKMPGDGGQQPDAGAVPSSSRRRLLKAGISATPVVMTVVSRPVLAGQCQSPSAFFSGNESNTGAGGPSCLGRTPGYWKQPQHFGDWPSGYYPVDVTGPPAQSATKFLDVFPTGPLYQSQFVGLKLLYVLDPQSSGSGPPFDVARHIVAAFLNSLAGLVPSQVLPVPMIKTMWLQYSTSDYYTFNVGSPWDHTQIVNYLLTTMPI